MLNQISWAGYIQTIAILLAVYYVVILFVYYKSDIVQLFSPKLQPVLATKFPEDKENAGAEIEQIGPLTDEVKALIHQAGYSRSPKEEILFALQKLLSSDRFQAIYESPFKDAVSNLIADECEMNCSMHLSEEDLKRLWVSK